MKFFIKRPLSHLFYLYRSYFYVSLTVSTNEVRVVVCYSCIMHVFIIFD